MKTPNQISVADYFTQQVELCGKTQATIAKEMGFPIPNVISNIKAGKTKLPLSRVGAAAKAVGVDALFLLKMMVKEYYPAEEDTGGQSLWSIIESATGRIVTENEYAIIQAIRELTNDTNPALKSDVSRQKLTEFTATL